MTPTCTSNTRSTWLAAAPWLWSRRGGEEERNQAQTTTGCRGRTREVIGIRISAHVGEYSRLHRHARPFKICTKRISRRDHFTCFHTAPRLWRIPPLIFLQQIQIWNFILSFISCCNLSDKQARVSANEVSRRTGIKLISLHEKLNTFKKQFSGLNWAGRPPWVNYTTYF